MVKEGDDLVAMFLEALDASDCRSNTETSSS